MTIPRLHLKRVQERIIGLAGARPPLPHFVGAASPSHKLEGDKATPYPLTLDVQEVTPGVEQ